MDFVQLFSTLFQKLALFITLATLQGTIDFAARKHHVIWRLQSIVQGIVFGLFATVDMLNPIHLSEGITLDTRNIIIMVVTASNNGVTGFVVMLIVCAVRISLGGAGTVPALGEALTAYALGRLYLRYGSRSTLPGPVTLVGFGFALALLNLVWFVFLPPQIALHILSLTAAPICIFYPLGTYIMHAALSYSRRYVKLKHRLDHEHTMLRTLIDNVPDYIHVRDINGKFLVANQAYANAAGLTPEAFLGKTMPDVFPNHLSPHAAQDYQTVMQGDSILGQMREVQMPGVGPLWMSVTKVPLRDPEGHVIGTIAVNRDMSESRRAEVALAESETRYRSVVQNMVEGVVLQNNNGEVETYNSQAEAILGLTREQMMNISPIDQGWRAVYEDMTPIGADNHPSIITLRTGQRQKNVVMGIYKPQNTLTWILINTEPLFAPNDTQPYAVISSFLDITERKAAEEQALRLAAEEQRIDALQKFIRNVAHDLRTPLSIMDVNVQLLQRTHKEEKSQQRFEVMQEQVDRITQLLNTFIDVMQYEEGGALEQRIEMNMFINQSRALYQELAEKKDQTLIIHPASSSLYVQGDEKQLRQALDSLLQNAIAYTPENGTITVSLTAQGDNLVLAVQDNGIGISTEDLPHIFERFYRVDNARSTLTGGSGLGLTLVQQIATNHKGRVEVESQIGQGCTFRLVLPLAQDPALERCQA